MHYYDLKNSLLSAHQVNTRETEENFIREVQSILDRYQQQIYSGNAKDIQQEMALFRDHILPITNESRFCKYCFDKPKGYAGDYITQEMIWLARTADGHWRYDGTSQTGRMINSLTMNMANPKANEERVYILRDMIRSTENKRVASIGCGSCIEFWGQDGMDVTDLLLLDQDIDALHSARRNINTNGTLDIAFKQDNILRYVMRKNNVELQDRGLIYLFGLLDYFCMKNARKIIHSLWRYVPSGGKLVPCLKSTAPNFGILKFHAANLVHGCNLLFNN